MSVKICVLMSTYNGEKYVEEQIYSIFNQDNVDIRDIDLYIRDDASSDSTLNILNRLASKYENSIHLLDSDDNKGPALSFMELIRVVPNIYDVYFLADQDDIWLTDKLMSAAKSLLIDNSPKLYCSNQFLYKKNGTINPRFMKIPEYGLISTLFGNHISGCTMAFNSEMFNILKSAKIDENVMRIRMHDTWIMLLANLCAEIIYDATPHILYRIHDNNTVGISDTKFSSRFAKFRERLQNKELRNGRSKTAKALLASGVYIDDEDKKILTILSSYQDGILNKIKFLTNKKILISSPDKLHILILKVLFNWI